MATWLVGCVKRPIDSRVRSATPCVCLLVFNVAFKQLRLSLLFFHESSPQCGLCEVMDYHPGK